MLLGLLFKLLHWSPLVPFLLACLVAFTVKSTFIDSLIMVKMMTSYLEAAPATQITLDRYGKLSAISSSFQEPFQKGQQENPSPACAEAAVADKTFCPSCGAPLPEQTAVAWTACWTRSTAAEAQNDGKLYLSSQGHPIFALSLPSSDAAASRQNYLARSMCSARKRAPKHQSLSS